MSRKATQRRGGRRTHAGPPRPPIEDIVVPRGRCFRNSRKGKLRFSEADAPKALKQAQANRARTGSAHCEERYYECKISEGGCGDFHLTSRQEYTPKGGAA